jgi:hypothetical protein
MNFTISGGVVNQNYEYYNDGRLSFVHNTTDNNFDRAFRYDQLSRLTVASAGGAARNDSGAIPMDEGFAYDAFDNPTLRETLSWQDGYSDLASYTNHRRAGWGYDANGSVSTIDTRSYTYDAAGANTSQTGQRWTTSGYVATTTSSGFDGDGRRVREEVGGSPATYYLRSSVLGGAIVEELNSSGQKQIGYVYTPSGQTLARQVVGQDYVLLKQVSPIGASQYEFFASNSSTGSDMRREFDPVGANIRLNPGPTGHAGDAGDVPSAGGVMGTRFGAIDNPGAGCTLDGVYVPCDLAWRAAQSGATGISGEVFIRYASGKTKTYTGVVDLSLGGIDQTWRGGAAQAAANGFFAALPNGFEAGILGAFANINRYAEEAGGRRAYAHANPQNSAQPQGTFDDAYKGCLGSLGGSVAPGLAQAADILDVANKTGVDPTLLAVTWRFEGSLDQYGEFNFQPTNGFHTRNTQTGDIGPGQLFPDICDKSPYTDDLNHHKLNAFGTNRNTGQVFNGNAYDNLIVTGRALGQARGNQRADAAGFFRAGNHSDSRYRARVQNFKDHGGNYDRFFECLAKKGFSP